MAEFVSKKLDRRRFGWIREGCIGQEKVELEKIKLNRRRLEWIGEGWDGQEKVGKDR